MESLNNRHSPRLLALSQKLEEGDTSALDRFWQEIALSGAPLIETITDDPAHVLVTFLWRALSETCNVVVVSAITGSLSRWRYGKNQMYHLPQTDLWYRTYPLPSDVRTTYELSPNDALTEVEDSENWGERTATFQNDPLNPHHFVLSADEESSDDEVLQSVLELPAAPPQPWSTPLPGVPSGTVELHRVRSQILDNERRVWVYTPPGYMPTAGPYNVIVLFDGFSYGHEIPTPTILDNLLASDLIPPFIAVLVDSLSWDVRERELTCSSAFVEFLAEELLLWVRSHYAITSDPQHTIVGGSSYGGLAACYAGLQRPDVFGNILSQSGAAYWSPDDDTDFEWITRQFVDRALLPLRFYLDVGLLENNPRLTVCPDAPTQLASTRHLRNVLRAKGYTVHYQEHNGGHDYLCWRGTLADGILALAGR